MFEITLKFLEAVKQNNSTARLHTHWDLYQQEKKRFASFVTSFLGKAKKLNPSREDLQVKDCIFRFNKDLRFSKEGKPYKENFWAVFAFGGKKSDFPCFYFHLQPGASFWGGGVFMSSATSEARVRNHLLKKFHRWETLIDEEKFKNYYGACIAPHQYKTTGKLKQLLLAEPQLLSQLSPSLERLGVGDYVQYPVSHPLPQDVERVLDQLAYFKDRIFEHPLSDEELKSQHLEKKIMEGFEILSPIIAFLEEGYRT